MNDGIGGRAEATAPPSGIPLLLAPLLAPYRHHRHLSIRVERLPHGARLSRGGNNGDRTWSLRPDELDDLTYLLPEGMNEAHTLVIRILNLDGDHGVTLAVLDLPITPGAAFPAPPPVAAVAAPAGDGHPGDDGELRRLRDQLTVMTASLAVRQAELAEARQMLDHARAGGSGPVIELELAAARAAWEAQLQERLAAAAAEAAANLARSRAAWEAEHQGRFAGVEAQMEQRIQQARGLWQQETQAILAKMEASWKASEVARLAAAETRWRAESAQVLAETKARAEQAEAASAAANARAQRAEAVSGQPRLEDELAKAHALWQHETQVALAQAEARWKADEAARLAAVEAKWRNDAEARLRKEPASALAEAKARFDQAEAALAEVQAQTRGDAVEIHVLRQELEEVKGALALRESELAEARSAVRSQDLRAEAGQRQRIEPLMPELQNDARMAAPSAAEPPRSDKVEKRQRADPLTDLHNDARMAPPSAAEPQSESDDVEQRQRADPLTDLYNDARAAATSRTATRAGRQQGSFARLLIRVGALAAVVALGWILYSRIGPAILERSGQKHASPSTVTETTAHRR